MKDNNIVLEKKHFRNVHLFNIDNFTNNIFKHRLVPPQKAIRQIEEIQESITVNKPSYQDSKDQLINQAIKLHLTGNIKAEV